MFCLQLVHVGGKHKPCNEKVMLPVGGSHQNSLL